MADDTVDISGMPDPTTIGLSPSAQADPTADMPTPAQLFRQHKGYDAPAQGEIDEFMRNPDETPDVRKQKTALQGLSMLSGLPSIAAQANPVTPVVAAVAGGLNALPASIGAILSGTFGNNPDEAARLGQVASDKLKSGAASVYNLANYLPSKIITKEGQGYADAVLGLPQTVAKAAAPGISSVIGEPATTSLGEWAGGAATLLPAAGVKGVASRALKLGKAGVKAAKASLATAEPPPGTPYDQTGTAVAPDNTIKPDVDGPVTGDSLRAQQNPIPAPEGTLHRTLTEEGKSPAAPESAVAAQAKPPAPTFESPDAEPTAPPPAPRTIVDSQGLATTVDSLKAKGSGESSTVTAGGRDFTVIKRPDATYVKEAGGKIYKLDPGEDVGAHNVLDIVDEAPPKPPTAPAQETQPTALGATPAGDAERGSAQLFSEPTKTGPQATPEPAQQGAREQSLNDVDKLSGGMLPSRRASAVSGDYNATGDDYQLKEVGSEPMRQQLASENSALHAAAENVHASVGSQFDNSVDAQALSDRGRVTRGAIQGIQDWFEKATDNAYDAARAAHGDQPMPTFLARAGGFLKDDANYMPEGFRRAAQSRLEQLRTAGDKGADGSTPAAPSSVAAAEKFREWLNGNRTLDNMHAVKQLVTHTDMDVAEHSGPTLFQAARDARRHQYQMLEEPTGIRKLLTPSDSQGINHAIPESKVMDYIADLPRDQHEHVLNVLRAGAHLGKGELAEQSAAAIREIQAHMVSRMHDAATNADGTWNARKFYNQASSYAPKLGDTFRDQPQTLRNLQTLNRAGNTLSMDKHFPGSFAQGERTGGMAAAALKGAGSLVASAAHEIPLVGRLVGRGIEGAVEGMSEKGREAARDKAAMSRLVDRNGKQRGSVQLFNDNDLNQGRDRDTFHGKVIPNPRSEYNANSQLAGGQRLTPEQNDIISRLGGGQPLGARVGGGKQRGALGDLSQRDAITHKSAEREDGTVSHLYGVPEKGGGLSATEYPGRGVTQVMTSNVNNKGQGWGTRMLQRAADDAHARGQVLHSDAQVSDGQAGAYSNLKKLGYDVRTKDNDHRGGAYHAVGDHVFEVRPGSNEYQAPKELEDFIKKSAPPHKVDPSGPSNWEELQARRNEKVMPINPQGGEGSIYKDVPTNMAFRAWHDKTHLDVNGGFDHDGELKTAHEQLRQAQEAGLSEESQKALWADTWETFKHHEDTGEFPKNPRAFVAQRMKDPTPLGQRVAASKQRGSVRVMPDAEPEEGGGGSMLNVGLHQGQPGEPGFKKMSKQQAQAAVESTGAKVTKNTVLTPDQHGVAEPTSVMSTDRPLTHEEMQSVLAKTKQSAIPQRADSGEESMHVAPGHEEIAKKEGWDKFNGDYFREHSGQTATAAAVADQKTETKPSFVWGEDPTPRNDKERLSHWDKLPTVKAGSEVDGLKVRDHVPNTDSISGSFDNYHVLSGVREIPFSAFENHITPVSMPSRMKQLRDDISTNKEINPLIVGIDEQGPYIMEGAHRYDALLHLGKDKFPAKIVVGKFDKKGRD